METNSEQMPIGPANEIKQIVVTGRNSIWAELANRWGLGVVGLAFVYIQIILPLFNAQTKFIETVSASVKAMETVVTEHKMINAGIETALDKIHDGIDQIDNGIEQLNATDSEKVLELHTIGESSIDNGKRLEAIEKKLNAGGG